MMPAMQKHTIVGWLVIIGVIVLIVVRKNSEEERRARRYDTAPDVTRIRMQRVNDAIELYRLAHREAPTRLERLLEPYEGEPFLEELPVDGWDVPFAYTRESRSRWEIRSAGPDGAWDTGDDLIHGRTR